MSFEFLKTTPDESASSKPHEKVVICLGGEGEREGAINVNIPTLLKPGWVACRDGTTTLDDIKKCGPVVICRSDKLPFADGVADEVVCNGVPIGEHCTWLGPAYPPAEIDRITSKKISLGKLAGRAKVWAAGVQQDLLRKKAISPVEKLAKKALTKTVIQSIVIK